MRWSVGRLRVRPVLAPALLAVIVIPVLLSLTIPVTTPLMVGYVLFALHVTVRRLARDPADA